MPLLGVALSLASQFLPDLVGKITGSKNAEQVASKVVNIAQGVTGESDPQKLVQAIAEDPNKRIKFLEKMHEQSAEIDKIAGKVVLSETKGNTLQRNWRPITMLVLVGIVVAHFFGLTDVNLTENEVDDVMTIIKIGLGGYVVGRSAEKIVPKIMNRK